MMSNFTLRRYFGEWVAEGKEGGGVRTLVTDKVELRYYLEDDTAEVRVHHLTPQQDVLTPARPAQPTKILKRGPVAKVNVYVSLVFSFLFYFIVGVIIILYFLLSTPDYCHQEQIFLIHAEYGRVEQCVFAWLRGAAHAQPGGAPWRAGAPEGPTPAGMLMMCTVNEEGQGNIEMYKYGYVDNDNIDNTHSTHTFMLVYQ